MGTWIAERITQKLIASSVIEEGDRELYRYGFFILLSSILYLVVAAIFGSAFGILWESIVFYFLFSILREYAGGIHAKTEQGCMLSTILALLLSIIGIRKMMRAKLSFVAMVLLIVGCAAVLFFSPLDVPEKPLSAEDWRHYRRISRRLAAAYALLGVWAAAAGWPILYPIAASTTLEGILLLTGTINQKTRTRKTRNEI